MKIKKIFKIIQGHQITDEEIYINEGGIPILTGQNEIKGYWNKQIIEKKDLPCITYPTKANSGEAYVQTELFDANNTAILIPSPEWRRKINLQWLASKLGKIFLDVQTSKKGVGYLNKEIVEEVDVEIPSLEEQIKQYKSIAYVRTLKEKLEQLMNKIERIKNSEFIVDYEKYQDKDVPALRIFDCISGNSGLTEEYIYQNLLSEGERKYAVLSGAIERDTNQKIHLCPKPKNKTEKITIFSGEGIHVVRKGKAGHINYLNGGDYTLNDDAYILKLKKESKYKISLKWFVTVYSNIFLQYASKSDNSTWNKNAFFKHAKFDIPHIKEQEKILENFKILREYEKNITLIKQKIENLLQKEIKIEATFQTLSANATF